jgi:hypothetical protein
MVPNASAVARTEQLDGKKKKLTRNVIVVRGIECSAVGSKM